MVRRWKLRRGVEDDTSKLAAWRVELRVPSMRMIGVYTYFSVRVTVISGNTRVQSLNVDCLLQIMCFLCHLRWLCCRLEKRIADTSKVFFAGFSHVSSHQSAKADARTSALCAAVDVGIFLRLFC
jgi:hypothetical protein